MKLNASCIVHPCAFVIWTGELQFFLKNEEFPVCGINLLWLSPCSLNTLPIATAHRKVRCTMCCCTHLFKPAFLSDFLCYNQALMRFDNLNAGCCSGKNKDFLFWTAFKSNTHPVISSALVSPAFKQDCKNTVGTQPMSR